jgi:hypothetical protein
VFDGNTWLSQVANQSAQLESNGAMVEDAAAPAPALISLPRGIHREDAMAVVYAAARFEVILELRDKKRRGRHSSGLLELVCSSWFVPAVDSKTKS